MINEINNVLGVGKLVSSYKQEYEYTCPKCGEERHLHVSLNKGIYTCVTPGCRNSGTLNYLIGMPYANYQKPIYKEELPNWELMQKICRYILEVGTLLNTHKIWLDKRGILPSNFISSNEVISKLIQKFSLKDLYTCGFISENKVSELVLRPNRILIPYFNNKGVYYMRSRSIVNSEIRYASPSRFPGRDVNWGWDSVSNSTDYVILTEGEFKAQSAKQLGFQCVAIPGINIGYNLFLKNVLERGIKEVYLLFDTENSFCKSTGISKQENITICENKIINMLNKYKIKSYKCRFQTPEEKMDIDKFILESKSPKEELLEILKRGI